MPSWKKIIVSGSIAELTAITASQGFSGSGGNLGIGTPTDGGYSDGFFNTFNANTKISDAIDEIGRAFNDLAPAKAGNLTGTSLINPGTVFSGILAGGLNSNHWYVGTSAQSTVTTLTTAASLTLNTNGSSIFHVGKSSDISATLTGGVSASKAIGNASLAVTSSRALSSGPGTTNAIRISGIRTYNTFWAQASASVLDTLSTSGSYKYEISSDGAGLTSNNTNTYQLWYISSYPDASIGSYSISLNNITYNYLSGIQYYKTMDIINTVSSSNVYNPVYSTNPLALTSTYFTTISTGSASPNWDTRNDLSVTRTLNSNLSSGRSVGTATLSISKPNKSNVTSNANIGTLYINSYTSDPGTNASNTITETFLGESNRNVDLDGPGFDSTLSLTGNYPYALQVRNGILIASKYGDYSGLSSGSTSDPGEYIRLAQPGTSNRISGTFTFVRNANAFATSTPITSWGGGGKLNVALVLENDVTGPFTASTVYDLGRAVGDDASGIKGIRNTISTNTSTNYAVTWALPSGVNTGAISKKVFLWVRYRSTISSDFISSITLTYN